MNIELYKPYSLNDFLNTEPKFYVLNVNETRKASKNTTSYKIGNLAGKTVRFFKSRELKSAVLISYWAFETTLTLLLLGTMSSSLLFTLGFGLLALWTYGTYALFYLIVN